jgi:hypothetical protein
MVSVCLAFWCSLAAAAPSGTETAVHGAGDVYGGAGATIAWAVLRGATEPATLVVLRVSADPAVYTAVEVVGRNPFSQSERIHLPPTPIAGRVDVRIPRSSFADFPRTELRFAARPGLTPLVVYYLSVPDTTPEFANQAALEAYLGDRIERTRAGKSP